MKSKFIASSILVLLACCCLDGQPAIAQTTSTDEQSQVEQVPFELLEKVVSIDFPGGTILEFVESLKKEVDFNCMIQDDAKKFRIPEIWLDDVRIISALDAMVFATNNEIMVDYESGPYVKIEFEAFDPPTTAVFNLKASPALPIINTADVLVEAIETALEFQGESTTPLTTKYHASSGLFFAKGTPKQIELVSQIVNRFTHGNVTTATEGSKSDPGLPGGSAPGGAEGDLGGSAAGGGRDLGGGLFSARLTDATAKPGF